MAYSIAVDKEACIGCGACVAACDTGFKMDDNKSIPVNRQVDNLSCHQEAADVCPVSCINISEK